MSYVIGIVENSKMEPQLTSRSGIENIVLPAFEKALQIREHYQEPDGIDNISVYFHTRQVYGNTLSQIYLVLMDFVTEKNWGFVEMFDKKKFVDRIHVLISLEHPGEIERLVKKERKPVISVFDR